MQSPQQPQSVLVVEDDRDILDMLEVALSDDYEVECVANVPSALALLDVWRPDVVLLDFLLPGGQSKAVLKKAECLGCAVVLTSGHAAALSQMTELPHQFLPKPFKLGELENAVATAWARRQSAQ